jgi:beta-barrel assembly-enhancing protease
LAKSVWSKKNKNATEEKLGDFFWDNFKANNPEYKNPVVVKAIDSIINKICATNALAFSKLKVHIVNNPQVNAFALPNEHLVVYTGLIKNVHKQEELIGVLCHELAHIQKSHVMKKLVTEVGLTTLLAVTTGKAGGDATKHILKTLTSTAFDRDLEKEADITAVDYMANANVNPAPFADFLFTLSLLETNLSKETEWLNTHPASADRAKYIIAYSADKVNNPASLLNPTTWANVKATQDVEN